MTPASGSKVSKIHCRSESDPLPQPPYPTQTYPGGHGLEASKKPSDAAAKGSGTQLPIGFSVTTLAGKAPWGSLKFVGLFQAYVYRFHDWGFRNTAGPQSGVRKRPSVLA